MLPREYIAYALLKDYLPHFNEKNKDESTMKMLYLISSCARKNLHLISERERKKPWGDEFLPTQKLFAYNFNYDSLSLLD